MEPEEPSHVLLLTHQTGSSHLTIGQSIWKHKEVFLFFTHTQLSVRESEKKTYTTVFYTQTAYKRWT